MTDKLRILQNKRGEADWMNMRDDWTVHMDESVSGIFYTAEETIRNVKDNFNIRRFYSSEGKDI